MIDLINPRAVHKSEDLSAKGLNLNGLQTNILIDPEYKIYCKLLKKICSFFINIFEQQIFFT